MKRLFPLLLALAAIPAALRAEVTPVPGSGDPHIQSVVYDPTQVVALNVSSGFAVTLRFSPDERIETVTLGDSGGWQAQVNKRADSLVVKPLGQALPTNLTVLTDQRSYTFALYEASTGQGFQPYLVTFTYPMAATGSNETTVESAAGQYQLRGEKALWPVSISNDGAFTALRWTEETTLPAVYSQDAKGNLALVNGTMRNGDYVIEGVPDRLVFVLGRARATARRLGGDSPK